MSCTRLRTGRDATGLLKPAMARFRGKLLCPWLYIGNQLGVWESTGACVRVALHVVHIGSPANWRRILVCFTMAADETTVASFPPPHV